MLSCDFGEKAFTVNGVLIFLQGVVAHGGSFLGTWDAEAALVYRNRIRFIDYVLGILRGYTSIYSLVGCVDEL